MKITKAMKKSHRFDPIRHEGQALDYYALPCWDCRYCHKQHECGLIDSDERTILYCRAKDNPLGIRMDCESYKPSPSFRERLRWSWPKYFFAALVLTVFDALAVLLAILIGRGIVGGWGDFWGRLDGDLVRIGIMIIILGIATVLGLCVALLIIGLVNLSLLGVFENHDADDLPESDRLEEWW